MSVRAVIILLALPLFLLLAGVNGLLLYDQETRDVEAGLRGEALSAAVTVAEFARQADDPFAALGEQSRLAALRAATARIPGLKALYLSRPGGPLLDLAGKPAVVRHGLTVPAAAKVVSDWTDAEGVPLVTALAPAGHGAMVVADIDAGPLARRTFHLKRLAAALIGGSAALAILLGLIVARRVTREFAHTRAIIASRGTGTDSTGLGIREVRELADAVGLLDKSVRNEFERITAKPAGGLPEGIATARARHFPDLTASNDGVDIAVRTLALAPPGSFAVALPCRGGWNVAIGEADGEAAEALAAAVAARDYVADGPPTGFADRASLAADGLGIDWRTLRPGAAEGVFVLVPAHAAAAEAYAARSPGLSAAELADDLAILFAEAGIVLVVRAAGRSVSG